MIRVEIQPEPADFDVKVRQPGKAFLCKVPNPTASEWKEYWSRAMHQLHESYKGTCAYSASPVRKGRDKAKLEDRSIDHFIPRSDSPHEAYEWNNYRLCRSRINGKKQSYRDVLDPFSDISDCFTLDFDTFKINPNEGISGTLKKAVQDTIDRLELNTDNDYVKERISFIRQYCLGLVRFNNLKRKYPFIAREMERQEFDLNHLERKRKFFKEHEF